MNFFKKALIAILSVGLVTVPATREVETVEAATENKIYFDPGVWNTANAWFSAWTWGGTQPDSWIKFQDTDGDGIFESDIFSDRTDMIFMRKNPSNTNLDWNGEWNRCQTKYSSSENMFSMTDWGSGEWSTYTPLLKFDVGANLYFAPNNNWRSDNARFAAYFYGTSNTWTDLVDTDSNGVYETTVPEGEWTHVIFCRMNSVTPENNWNNKWNQTGDIAVSEGNNYYSLDEGSWDTGKWLKYEDYNFMTHGDKLLLRAVPWIKNRETNSVAVKLWSNSDATWLPMTYIENTSYFEITVPDAGVYNELKFAQMSGSESSKFETKYVLNNNYTNDIKYNSTYNVYEISDKYEGGEVTTCIFKNTKVGTGYYVPVDAKAQLSMSYMADGDNVEKITRVGARLGSGPIKSRDVFVGVNPVVYGVELTVNSKTITKEWTNETVGKVNLDGSAFTGEGTAEYIQWSIALDNIKSEHYSTDFSYKVFFQVSNAEDATKYYMSERTTNAAKLAKTYYDNAANLGLDAVTTAACKIVAGIA